MRRTTKVLGWIVAALLGMPALLLAALLLALNTGAGQRVAVRLIDRAAGGSVGLVGLHGRFPDALRLDRIELRDAKGPYAVITGAALDWSPLRLVRRELAVRLLAAGRVEVLRLPAGSAAGSGGGASAGLPASLPLRIDLAALRIGRLDLAEAVAGAAASLSVAGQAQVADLHTGRATLTLNRLDAPGTYHVEGRLDGTTFAAGLVAEEPAQGLIATLAGLPGLGALAVHASLDGPLTAAATRATVAAGPLRLEASGTVDVTGGSAKLDLHATAPAMAPRPDLSWQSVALDAHIEGRFTDPQARATLRIAGLAAGGASVATLAADLSGDAGHARLTATAAQVRVPGPQPDLLAAAPLTLHADADLAAAGRPVRFTLAHPLLMLDGTAMTAGPLRATAHFDVPDLAPLAAVGGVDLQGHAALDLTGAEGTDGAIAATVGGTLGVTGGMAPVPALLGPAARIDAAATLHGADVTLTRLSVAGRTASLAAHGAYTGGVVALDWQAALSDLSVLAVTVQGTLDGHGRLAGRAGDLAAQVVLTGEVAAAGVPRGPVGVTLDASGLPARPSGRITAHGTLDGAPLALDATAARDTGGTLHLAITRAAWKSAHAEGAFTLAPQAKLPLGRLSAGIARLDDLSALLGRRLAGSVTATAEMAEDAGTPVARIKLDARGAGLPGTATIGTATLDATVRDPVANPDVAATLDLAGLSARAIGGTARLTANGRQSALALRLQTSLQGVAGADLQASAAATLDVPQSRVTLAALDAAWHGETLRLLAPARIGYAPAVSVDRLRLGVQQAVLEVAGRVSPTLDLTASLRNVTADLARAVAPGVQADGVLTADARLTGSIARPAGTLRLAATGLHMRHGAAASLPPASLTAEAQLAGSTAAVQARFAAGRNTVSVDGTAPIDTQAAMRLHAQGAVDLTTLNPLLTASGRHVLGQVNLDATATGTLAAPRATGTLRLAGGDVQDFVLGAHVTAITALVEADGDTIHIAHFAARAGDGSIAAAGTLGLAGAMPVALTLTARQARPLASDRLTATLDADLALHGDVQGALTADGTVKIDKVEFRIPDKLPASVAVLNVRRPGQAPPAPAAPGPDIALDMTVTAPGQVFISGRGLFAELAGRIKVGGTAAALAPVGVFRLRRGEFNLAGTALAFTSGDIRFEGSGSLDPALNLVASSTNGSIIATLTVGGFASAPKITLSSVPQLPQDEVLAQLLFHQSASSLSPLQLASAAAALAQASGAGGGVFAPLDSLRQQLGLDKLTIGGGQGGTGATVEAGRYVTNRVYVGARQSADGSGTQATVQIDLLRGLKLETDVGTGGATTVTGAGATADPYGTSVGLTYQFQY